MRGDLVYHCRNCGAYFSGFTVPDLDTAMALIADDRETPREWGPPAGDVALHRCNDAAVGLADLVRGEKPSLPAGYTPAPNRLEGG